MDRFCTRNENFLVIGKRKIMLNISVFLKENLHFCVSDTPPPNQILLFSMPEMPV